MQGLFRPSRCLNVWLSLVSCLVAVVRCILCPVDHHVSTQTHRYDGQEDQNYSCQKCCSHKMYTWSGVTSTRGIRSCIGYLKGLDPPQNEGIGSTPRDKGYKAMR